MNFHVFMRFYITSKTNKNHWDIFYIMNVPRFHKNEKQMGHSLEFLHLEEWRRSPRSIPYGDKESLRHESEASTCGPDTRYVSALRCPIWIGCVQANVIKIEGQ